MTGDVRDSRARRSRLRRGSDGRGPSSTFAISGELSDEAVRVLKPAGVLVLATPHAFDPLSHRARAGGSVLLRRRKPQVSRSREWASTRRPWRQVSVMSRTSTMHSHSGKSRRFFRETWKSSGCIRLSTLAAGYVSSLTFLWVSASGSRNRSRARRRRLLRMRFCSAEDLEPLQVPQPRNGRRPHRQGEQTHVAHSGSADERANISCSSRDVALPTSPVRSDR